MSYAPVNEPPQTQSQAPRHRSGRRPGETETRRDLLRAARQQFAQHGYDGATLRAIARQASVDTALIHYFFVSKSGIFSAAIVDAFNPDALVARLVVNGPEGMGERLAEYYLSLWENPESGEPLMAIVRSAITNAEARAILTDVVTQKLFKQVGHYLNADDAEVRMSFVGSQLVGVALLRYILKVEPLASLDRGTVTRTVGATLQRYLTGNLALHAIQAAD
jgi:AcrR family transcriptional regulator